MKTLGQIFVVVSSAALAACSTVKVSTDYDRLTTFDSYKTYAWAPHPKTRTVVNVGLDSDVRGSVDQGLAAKGLKKTAGARPDVFVIYHFTGPTKNERHYTDWGFAPGGGPGDGFYGGWAVPTQTNGAIDKGKPGALVLDFVDARRRSLVWRSVAPQVVEGAKGDDSQRTKGAIKAMLAGYPPKAL
jgi:Domain of unknown function (DUF4136)